jgi:hypothetical protein
MRVETVQIGYSHRYVLRQDGRWMHSTFQDSVRDWTETAIVDIEDVQDAVRNGHLVTLIDEPTDDDLVVGLLNHPDKADLRTLLLSEAKARGVVCRSRPDAVKEASLLAGN